MGVLSVQICQPNANTDKHKYACNLLDLVLACCGLAEGDFDALLLDYFFFFF